MGTKSCKITFFLKPDGNASAEASVECPNAPKIDQYVFDRRSKTLNFSLNGSDYSAKCGAFSANPNLTLTLAIYNDIPLNAQPEGSPLKCPIGSGELQRLLDEIANEQNSTDEAKRIGELNLSLKEKIAIAKKVLEGLKKSAQTRPVVPSSLPEPALARPSQNLYAILYYLGEYDPSAKARIEALQINDDEKLKLASGMLLKFILEELQKYKPDAANRIKSLTISDYEKCKLARNILLTEKGRPSTTEFSTVMLQLKEIDPASAQRIAALPMNESEKLKLARSIVEKIESEYAKVMGDLGRLDPASKRRVEAIKISKSEKIKLAKDLIVKIVREKSRPSSPPPPPAPIPVTPPPVIPPAQVAPQPVKVPPPPEKAPPPPERAPLPSATPQPTPPDDVNLDGSPKFRPRPPEYARISPEDLAPQPQQKTSSQLIEEFYDNVELYYKAYNSAAQSLEGTLRCLNRIKTTYQQLSGLDKDIDNMLKMEVRVIEALQASINGDSDLPDKTIKDLDSFLKYIREHKYLKEVKAVLDDHMSHLYEIRPLLLVKTDHAKLAINPERFKKSFEKIKTLGGVVEGGLNGIPYVSFSVKGSTNPRTAAEAAQAAVKSAQAALIAQGKNVSDYAILVGVDINEGDFDSQRAAFENSLHAALASVKHFLLTNNMTKGSVDKKEYEYAITIILVPIYVQLNGSTVQSLKNDSFQKQGVVAAELRMDFAPQQVTPGE